MSTNTKELDIIVIGGSLAGLIAGVALKRLGHKVRILERNPTPILHNQGAGLVAGGELQTFFERYDLTRTPLAITSPWRQYLNRGGEQILKEDWQQRMTSWDLLYNILRANFDGSSDSYISAPPSPEGDGSGLYSYGCYVTAITEVDEHKVKVSYRTTAGAEEDAIADLVIGADGASSKARGIFEPGAQRKYAGYVCWRGTLPEADLSTPTQDTMVDKFTFYHSDGLQALAYVIPGERGTLERGKRLCSWAWYRNAAEGSEQHDRFLTDVDGLKHKFTLPIGKMHPAARQESIEAAEKLMPPQFAECVRKTKQPFVQGISDVIASQNSYFNGKVLLLGDAVAGFRPHTAASASQAALDTMFLVDMLKGDISLKQWEEHTMEYARRIQHKGVVMGQRSQFEKHPMSA